MRIALFGASGTIGRRIAQEALDRGHTVTAILRHPDGLDLRHEHLTAVAGDVTDPARVARAVAGHDVVVSAIAPSGDQQPQILVQAAHALIEGLPRAGVKRLVVVNGAGSLEVAPGMHLVDTPDFPAAWRPVSLAHRDTLEVYRAARADLDWTVLSPAALIQPGERTGTYRTGTDQLLTDAAGQSRISAEDYAVALLDEVETPRFIRQRFTVAY
jgi:uncharacterized protein